MSKMWRPQCESFTHTQAHTISYTASRSSDVCVCVCVCDLVINVDDNTAAFSCRPSFFPLFASSAVATR